MTGTIGRTQQDPAGLEPYPEYRDSSPGWPGKIPAHWQTKALKREFRVVNGSTPKTSEPEYWDGDIPWVTPDDLGKTSQRVIKEPARHISHKGYESCATQIVEAGSLILSTRAPIGHLAVSGAPVCTNQGCRSLVPRHRCDETYFYFLLRAGRPVLEAAGRGSTFKELAKEDLESVVLPIPPQGEQRAIADFLDRETAKIDALAAKKERLIALLQEKRTALITRAVTRGLDSGVPTKNSGLAWLGPIPTEWQLTRLKHLAEVRASGIDKNRRAKETDIRFLGTATVYNIRELRNDLSLEIASVSATELQAYLLRQGDILLTKDSVVPTRIADVSIVAEPLDDVVCGYHLTMIRSNPSSILPRFLFWYLSCYAVNSLFLSEARGTTIIGLGSNTVRGTPIVELPIAEQRAIADFLDRETAKIDALIVKVEEAIDHLNEFRTALISAAVTGRIDVRKAASRP